MVMNNIGYNLCLMNEKQIEANRKKIRLLEVDIILQEKHLSKGLKTLSKEEFNKFAKETGYIEQEESDGIKNTTDFYHC